VIKPGNIITTPSGDQMVVLPLAEGTIETFKKIAAAPRVDIDDIA
jgi:hypothetical protein